MEINVSGRNISVGDALTDHVEGRLQEISDKYFSRPINGGTVFNKEGPFFRADVSLHPGPGMTMQSRGEADDPYAAFEEAAAKVEKQLRRYKRRLKNHHNTPSRDVAEFMARDIVVAPEADDAEVNGANGHGEAEDAPVIIAETKREIPRVSVGDAVMLMDLGDMPVFMFRNSKNDQFEVVYRRADGNIGWISPE